MKIIHVTPSYKPAFIYGGPISSVAQLCEALQKAGQNIEVLTTTANGKTELPVKTASPVLIDGVQVTYFNRITKDHTHFSPQLLWHIYQITKKRQQGLIIHIHSWWNFTALFSCAIAKAKKIPVVLSPRGMLTPYSFSNRHSAMKSFIHFFIGKNLIKYCSIHATSEKERQDILTISKQLNIHIIPNLMKPLLPEFNTIPQDAYHGDAFRLLFFSRIEEKKGLELLFEALSMLSFPWVLTIAGDGKKAYIKKLKNLTEALGIHSKIQWVGHIGDPQKHTTLRKNDLLVLFSYNENFANVVGESLMAGTSVAISDQVGIVPFILKYNLGWVSALDPKEISEVIQQAYEGHEKRALIRNTAPALVNKYFKDTIAHQYSFLYSRLS